MSPRPQRVVASARTVGSSGACVLAFVVVLAGCDGGESSPTDAATRPDAPVAEAGLTYLDATLAPSDAAAYASDAATSCAGACDPRTSSGCDDQACALVEGAPECSDEGVLDEGAACTESRACAAGLACFGSSPYDATCQRVCCAASAGDSSACSADEVCTSGDLVDGVGSAWGHCAAGRSCTLLADVSGCAATEGCYVVDWLGTTRCLPAGRSTAGEACEASNDCSTGLVCVGALEKTCLALCSVSTGRPCSTTASCVRQSYTPEGVGVCIETTP